MSDVYTILQKISYTNTALTLKSLAKLSGVSVEFLEKVLAVIDQMPFMNYSTQLLRKWMEFHRAFSPV